MKGWFRFASLLLALTVSSGAGYATGISHATDISHATRQITDTHGALPAALPAAEVCQRADTTAPAASAETSTTRDTQRATTPTDAAQPAYLDTPRLTALLDAITRVPLQSQHIEKALAAVPATQQQDPLVARARLVLAALQLQAGHVDLARTQLRLISLDSEAAIDASLLMAESYAATDSSAALQWNLRAQQRWPDEPTVLAATLQRSVHVLADLDTPATQERRVLAADISSTASSQTTPTQDLSRAARAAVAQTRDDAIAARDRLIALHTRLQRDDWFDRWLHDAHTPPLTPDMLPVFYRTLASATFLVARQTALASAQPALCARARAAQLEALRLDIDRIETESRALLATREPQAATLHAAFLQAEQAFREAHHEVNQPVNVAQGQAVNRLRNAANRATAEVSALRSMIEGLPAARARLAQHAQQLLTVSTRIQTQASNDVRAALNAALDAREAALRDTAGDAAQTLGEWQDPRYRRR